MACVMIAAAYRIAFVVITFFILISLFSFSQSYGALQITISSLLIGGAKKLISVLIHLGGYANARKKHNRINNSLNVRLFVVGSSRPCPADPGRTKEAQRRAPRPGKGHS